MALRWRDVIVRAYDKCGCDHQTKANGKSKSKSKTTIKEEHIGGV